MQAWRYGRKRIQRAIDTSINLRMEDGHIIALEDPTRLDLTLRYSHVWLHSKIASEEGYDFTLPFHRISTAMG